MGAGIPDPTTPSVAQESPLQVVNDFKLTFCFSQQGQAIS